MKNLIILALLTLFGISNLFSQASSVENLKRATAKEIGNNTRTEDVVISNIKRKATSVKWSAKINDVCYECDADDMVRSIHIVKLDCSLVAVEPPKDKPTEGAKTGPTDPLGAAIHKKIQEDKARRQGSSSTSQTTESAAQTSPKEEAKPATGSDNTIEELRKWKKLLDEGVINQQEFDVQKKKILEGK